VTAAIGVAVGLGYWSGAVATTVATVVCLYALKTVERDLLPRMKGDKARFSIRTGAGFELTHLGQSGRSRGRGLALETSVSELNPYVTPCAQDVRRLRRWCVED
jgi:hypothetical protein